MTATQEENTSQEDQVLSLREEIRCQLGDFAEKQRQLEEDLRSLRAGQGQSQEATRQQLQQLLERDQRKTEFKSLHEERALAAEQRHFQRLEEEIALIRRELGENRRELSEKELRLAALESIRGAPVVEPAQRIPVQTRQIHASPPSPPPPAPPAPPEASQADVPKADGQAQLPSVRALVATFEQRKSANSPSPHVVRTAGVRGVATPS